MASLYKKPVIITDLKTGQKVKTKSKKWWGRFKDEDGIEQRVPLAVDKTAAQTMLNELVRKTERRAAGLIDRFDDHRKQPIDTHLDEFRKHLQARRVSDAQVKLVVYRAERIIEACRVRILTDLSASRVQKFLADLRADGLSIQTSNYYLRAIKQFSRWLVRDRRGKRAGSRAALSARRRPGNRLGFYSHELRGGEPARGGAVAGCDEPRERGAF